QPQPTIAAQPQTHVSEEGLPVQFPPLKTPPIEPVAPQMQAPEGYVPLPEQPSAPAIDESVIKGLMKRGFTREQAYDFASKSTVTPATQRTQPPAATQPPSPATLPAPD